MSHWFILSAIGRDKPGLVAELTELIYDADANLEDSRMTILGTDFAVILLASSDHGESSDRISLAAKALERDHGLTILVRSVVEGRRPAVPSPGTHPLRIHAAGEDKAGIVMGVCRALAEHGVNICELSTSSQPGPGGSPNYQLDILAEVPEGVEKSPLEAALDGESDRLVIDIRLEYG
jgi:glycine cleavage system transcriptional repressor